MNNGRIFAASDIHGHGRLLSELLAHVQYNPCADRLYLLGDYINKGPNSLGTLRYVRRLHEAGAVVLLGNNELKWMRSPQPEAVAWRQYLEQLPLWTEDGPFLFVHAGFRPGVTLQAQCSKDLTEIRGEFIDHFNISGRTVVFGHTPTFRLGAPYGQVWTAPGKLGIDTGAGHGARLSLVNLTAWEVNSISAAMNEKTTIETYSINPYSMNHIV